MMNCRSSAFIDTLAKKGGESMKKDVEKHFKDEFSTYDWVLDGLLIRAGFTIRSKHIDGGVLGTYLCVKNRGRAALPGAKIFCRHFCCFWRKTCFDTSVVRKTMNDGRSIQQYLYELFPRPKQF